MNLNGKSSGTGIGTVIGGIHLHDYLRGANPGTGCASIYLVRSLPPGYSPTRFGACIMAFRMVIYGRIEDLSPANLCYYF